MASVWRAEDLVLERTVAVKVISDTIASDPEFLARFRREARVAAGLWHPNLIGIYDFGEGAERPYLVMEYVPGPNLAQRMAEVEGVDCERLARELLGAVTRIHAAGIVHRDIKPQNILIAPDGSAKLIDFGIALPADATALTRTGQLLGTARYVAPEVMNGEAASKRSDLYSCGVLLRDCLGPSSPTHLRVLAERLANPDPRGRPGSAESALARLNRHAVDLEQPTERLRPVLLPPPGQEAPRRRLATVAAALAGAAAVAIVLVLILSGSPRDGRERAASKPAVSDARKVTGGDSGAVPQPAPVETTAPEPEATAPQLETTVPAGDTGGSAESDPELGRALNQQGFEMIQAGRPEEAVPLLEEAVESFPEDSEELDYAYALFNLGNALRLSGRPEEAIPVLERRLEIPNQTTTVQRELEAAEREAAQ